VHCVSQSLSSANPLQKLAGDGRRRGERTPAGGPLATGTCNELFALVAGRGDEAQRKKKGFEDTRISSEVHQWALSEIDARGNPRFTYVEVSVRCSKFIDEQG